MRESTKEIAARIRRNLKKVDKTWNAKKISVRTRLYSMGSSIDVTIKDATVNFAAVRDIAESEQVVRTCEYSGDILGGGNLFIHVDFAKEALESLTKQAREEIGDKESGKVLGLDFSYDDQDWCLINVGDDGIGDIVRRCWNRDGLAQAAARVSVETLTTQSYRGQV